MSDSVVPTPSEKPTCDIDFFGKNKRCETHNRVFAVNHPCPGPVIATPKEPTCEHDNVGAHWNWAARNGREVDYCNGPVIATPEKC